LLEFESELWSVAKSLNFPDWSDFVMDPREMEFPGLVLAKLAVQEPRVMLRLAVIDPEKVHPESDR
jgi:hypothetical protein